MLVRADSTGVLGGVLGRVRRSWTMPQWFGERQANSLVLVVLGLQRAGYVLPLLAAALSGSYRRPGLNLALLVATAAWNIWLFGTARHRGRIEERLVWLDIGWTAVLLLLVDWNSPPGALDWSTRAEAATAALAGDALGSVPAAGAGLAVLLTAYGISLGVGPATGEGIMPELASCVTGLLWYAVVLGRGLRYLRRQGRLLDRARTESRQAAANARATVRLAYSRALHDTVLPTLTAIARGGIDPSSEEIRRRCAHDADYVRRLLINATEEPSDLGERLTDVVGAMQALGLRVHDRRSRLPAGLPVEVVEGVGDATREALNNVYAHAGTRQGWLTVTWEDGRLAVRVVDRGGGFTPSPERLGFGLRHSVIGRMAAVGGIAHISSEVGDGTCVELRWPR